MKESKLLWLNLQKQLARYKNDKAALANFKRGFSKRTEFYVWPYLSEICNLEDNKEYTVCLFLIASFGYIQSLDCKKGNFGDVIRQIAKGEAQQDSLSSFEPRFRRILAANDLNTLFELLKRVIFVCHRKGILINYEQLFYDLILWGRPDKKVQIEWARAFWKRGSHQTVQRDGETGTIPDKD